MSFPARVRARIAKLAGRHDSRVQTILAFSVKLLGAVASFAFSFVIARTFGAAGTGSFALAQTTAMIGSTVALFGLDYFLIRTVAGDVRVGDTAAAAGSVRKVAQIVASFAVVVAVALALAGVPILHQVLGKGRDAGVLLFAALAILPLALTRIAVVGLRGAGSIVTAQWFDGPMAMSMSLVGLAALIVTSATRNVSDLVLLYCAAAAIGKIIAWGAYRRRTRNWAAPASVPARPMLSKSWRISLTVLAATVADWLILLILGRYFGPVEVGQFRTAWQITALVALVVSTLDTVSGPRIAAASRVKDIDGIRKLWRQSALIMTMGSLPLLVVVLAVPEWVLGLFGDEFVVAAPALRILALGQMFNIATGSVGAVLMMTGREAWSLRLALLSLAVLGLTGVFLIPRYGIAGAAMATALSVIVRNGTMTVLVWRQLRRSPA